METFEQQRRPTIGQFASRLKQSGLDVNAVDIADILWLTQFIEPRAAVRQDIDNKQTKREKTTPLPEITETSTAEQSDFALVTDRPSGSESVSEPASVQDDRSAEQPTGMPFPATAAPALRTRLDLARSLKPLMRKVPSKVRFDLDEEETVTQIAETRVWMPRKRPRPERWLDLDLVVEGSKTTVLWERAIAELQHLTEYHGAFRTVRTWRLEAQNSTVQLFPRWNTFKTQSKTSQRPRNPKEILDPSGRRLVLFVTDCTSALWRQGLIHETLRRWSEVQPIAIVQMLPERLWGRTALSDGYRVQLSSISPGTPNAKLEVYGLPILDDRDEWAEDEEESLQPIDKRLLTLPIVTLDPNPLHRWAQVVAGTGEPIPGRTFELAFVRERATETPALQSLTSRTARQRVALFQATASQTAQKLAGLMAATSVSLPVIDLLRDEFLPEAQQAHVAEVLLSGLLRRCDTEDEETHYEFFGDGATDTSDRVRYLLLDGLPEDKAVSVLNRLSQVISQKAGLSLNSFEAFLVYLQESEHNLGEAALPFARVGLNTLCRLGGDYATLARRYSLLNGNTTTTKELPLEDIEYEVAEFINFPPLQDFEYEPAKITHILERFEFETAQIEWQGRGGSFSSPSSQVGQLAIVRRRATNWGYTEVLNEEIGLEMISIPSGTFVMGAPGNEVEGVELDCDREQPRHQVTLSAFYLGRYPITQAQWRIVAAWSQIDRALDFDPSHFKGDNHPVEEVSWEEAVEFCRRLSAKTGKNYRLPSESEWEYACRAGTNTPFHFGRIITTNLANYNGNATYKGSPKGEYREQTTDVGSFPANHWGLHDLHGNVSEWCEDDWHSNYKGAPEDGRTWLEKNTADNRKVLRGGCWFYGPESCRSAFRFYLTHISRDFTFGFRVCCEAPKSYSI
ncbi:MAG: SAV_2336 N-terminal domain-related protein [Cyanophyceae cyanobacterium]